MYFFFFGSHPKISELELREVSKIARRVVPTVGAFVNDEVKELAQMYERLGGSTRLAREIQTFEKTSNLHEELVAFLSDFFKKEGIKKYVISFYGRTSTLIKSKQFAVSIRKSEAKAKYAGKDSFNVQSPTTVFYLLQRGGTEISLVELDNQIHVLQTFKVQDPNYWTLIDFEKPHREKHVGMLPSKLARIMVNLAQPKLDEVIWDPFVGQGTVLMQANLLGYNGLGSDIEPKILQLARENIDWLLKTGLTQYRKNLLEVFDIRNHSSKPPFHDLQIDAIVTEPFLGEMRSRPFASMKDAERVWLQRVSGLYLSLFKMAENTLDRGGRLVFAKPIYRYIDRGKLTWYNPVIHINPAVWKRITLSTFFEDNIWTQKDNVIARELVVLEKIDKLKS